jgi:uncharacterized protein
MLNTAILDSLPDLPGVYRRADIVRLVKRLVELYEPMAVYLFGSVARQEFGSDSDIDLLLVVPDDADPERKASKMALDEIWQLGKAVDVVIWTRSGFDQRRHLPASLPATVLREGVLLYAA